jgi:FKBP-type peptidyl-prolyl cis-trans isomerase
MPGPGDAVQIDYVGRLANGKVFDQAKGAGMMVSGTVPGFAEALQHMNLGGSYRVWIPPQLAYGAEGAGGGVIPPNATLDFTITLRDIGHPVAPPAQ